MPKRNLKIFTLSFVFVYALISGLCIINRQPLVFSPGYGFPQFFELFILLGVLSFSLCIVMEIFEKILQRFITFFTSSVAIYAYFVFASLFGLFVFTLFAGFVESGLPFFYYGCITNSCIYLLGGYTATFIVAVYFARRFIKENWSQA